MHELIKDFLDDVKRSKAENTYVSRKTDLKHYDEWLEEEGLQVTDVEPRDIHRFLRDQGTEYADETVKVRYYSIKLLYDFLAGVWDVIDETPMKDLDLKDYAGNEGGKKHQEADIVYLTPEERDEIVKHVTDPKLRNELIIRLMFQTGVRRAEVVNIELEDVDRNVRAIDVFGAKTNSWRTVYYQPSLDTLMDQWIDIHRPSFITADKSPYLFLTRYSEQLNEQQPNRIVKDAAEKAGIQDVLYRDVDDRDRYRITAHALRHGHAVHALKSGIDVRTVQEHMGHSNIDTTMQYLRIIEDDVRKSYRQFGNVKT